MPTAQEDAVIRHIFGIVTSFMCHTQDGTVCTAGPPGMLFLCVSTGKCSRFLLQAIFLLTDGKGRPVQK